ncbi:MAG: DUF393 domain-containing protein [Acidobacteriota bacterium]|nr:DUF393 domain-containing protein [Acidobacteriota bacterium]
MLLVVGSVYNLGGRLLVIFDGHCGLCNRSVQWLLRRDRRDRLRFAPSESPQAAALLTRLGFNAHPASGPGTILVVLHPGEPQEQALCRSGAVVALLRELPRPWPAVGVALRLIPRPLRDLGYRLIARWRYRIWGRHERCPLPAPEHRERFL